MSVGATVGMVVLVEGLLVLAAVLRLVRGLRSASAFTPLAMHPTAVPPRSALRDGVPGPREGGSTVAMPAGT